MQNVQTNVRYALADRRYQLRIRSAERREAETYQANQNPRAVTFTARAATLQGLDR